MIAPCGLDCSICKRALADTSPCAGCRGLNDNKPEFCSTRCGIIQCEKQLLNAVKDYSKDNGLAGIVLFTSGYAPAAKFYEKNGFKLSNGTICMYCE